ncbi:hypothetical protein BPAE_0063g00450 [Botrytis paeoniae]|uniref:Uncharacterized protein n=1 Tax=Botrytis paeoniae TaxID=278948 RepID=A0A4Z1FNN8_9HELO|nr:hypothetical protein BPAE_0063g00450 [Botrytis paeoniae]
MNPQSPVAIASNHDRKRTHPSLQTGHESSLSVADSPPVNRNTYIMRSGIAVTAVLMVTEL